MERDAEREDSGVSGCEGARVDLERLGLLIKDAKKIAKEYRQLTGKPLGITGEVGEYEAARALKLELATARQAGYDAIRRCAETPQRIEIKTRVVLGMKPKPGQRVGQIKLEAEWDRVVLVLLNEDFEPTEMYEAGREEITAALTKPGSKARNERGALSVSRFKTIGARVWPPC